MSTQSNPFDLIIVGGGAAGFFAAATAARAHPGLNILILERSERPLGKVRISGGGRCNLTHACFDPQEMSASYPRGSKELRAAFEHFQPRDTMRWFEKRGVEMYTQEDGCVFPLSDDSQTIIDCLMGEAEQLGVRLYTGCGIRSLQHNEAGFRLEDKNGKVYSATKVLLAVGGGSKSAYALAAGLGHTILPPVPSLFTFSVPDPRLQGLAGIVVDIELSLAANPSKAWEHSKRKISVEGPLLITHWGLSGPAVLKLSAWGARDLADCGYKCGVQINWLPDETVETLLAELLAVRAAVPRQHALTHDPSARLPVRLWKSLLAGAGIQESEAWNELSNKRLRILAEHLTRGIFHVQGKGPYKDEFVTCGGVSLKEVNFKTMESRLVSGLYFAGEFLDIDGLTGGYNFQAAWTTAWLAGMAMAG
jgi:predicted Rossmann fold flavoprotein